MAQASQARQFRGIFSHVATGFTTTDVASIASGAQATVTVTVPGVTLDGSWLVFGVSTSADPGAVALSARVTAADTVKIFIVNNSGGAVDPASMTYRVAAGKLSASAGMLL